MKKRSVLLIGLAFVLIVSGVLYGVYASKGYQDTNSSLKIEKSNGLMKIGDDIIISYTDTNTVNMTLFISDGKGTLIDAGYEEPQAKRMLDYIKQNNIALQNIIITHPDLDHVKYLDLFTAEGIEVFRYDNTENGQTVQSGEDVLRLIDTPGHVGDRHISVEIEKYNILVAGDVVTTSLIPGLGYGSSPQSLINTLESLRDNKYALVIPGHGEPMSGKAAIKLNLDYIYKLRKEVGEQIKQGKRLQELDIPLQDYIKNFKIEDMKVVNAVHMNNQLEMYYLLKKQNN